MKLFRNILIMFIMPIFIICLIMSILFICGFFKSQRYIEKEFLKNKEIFENIKLLLVEKDKIYFDYEGNDIYVINENGNERNMTDEDKEKYKEIIKCIDKFKLSGIWKANGILEFRYKTLRFNSQIVAYMENEKKYDNSNSRKISVHKIVDDWYYIDIGHND